MDNDDQQVGRLLTRREALTMIAAAGAAMLAGCGPTASSTTQATNAATQAAAVAPTLNAEAATVVATAAAQPATSVTALAVATGGTIPQCVVTPAVTEGPYFVDEKINRSDIRSDPADNSIRAGLLLALTFNVSQISSNNCIPLPGATVDVWHCDAQGVYSDVSDAGFNTKGQKFLRGYQTTDAQGVAAFTTIYPGWYSGRAVHIHFKIRADNGAGGTYEFTSQLFFDDTLSDQVFSQAPYANKGQRDTTNSTDGIYQGGGGQLLLAATKADQGYTATFHVGLDLSGQSQQQQSGGPGGPPPGGRPGRPGATATP